MELTSAVRSVSCSNGNSLGGKCLSNNTGHNATAGSLGRGGGNLPTNKDDGSGHEGDDEDEYGGGHGMTKTASTSLASSSAGSLNKSAALFHAGHSLQQPPNMLQQHQQPVDGVYPRQYPMLNGYMAGGCNSWQPPGYRHPPPPPHLQGPDMGYPKQTAMCHCCGEVQMIPKFYNPAMPFQQQQQLQLQQQQQLQQQHQHQHQQQQMQQRPMFQANYVNGGIHFKNCPRAVNFNMPEKRLSYNESDAEHFRFPGPNQMGHYLLGNVANHPGAYPLIHRPIPMQPQFVPNSYQRRPSQGWAPVGILRNAGGGGDRSNFAQTTSNHNQVIGHSLPLKNCLVVFFFSTLTFTNNYPPFKLFYTFIHN
jgi:hypothetical protein